MEKNFRRRRVFAKSRAEMLNQVTPISRQFGMERGQSIDRYYIEKFLSEHAGDIHGHVLEIGDDSYARQFGGNRVAKCDVLHARNDNPKATIIGDLATADRIPSGQFDCIVLTQTLQFIYDVPSAIRHIHRTLKPGGVVLATIPGISQISEYDEQRWGDYWRFTATSAMKLFEKEFSRNRLEIDTHGNALVAGAFLHGLAAEELREDELDVNDSQFQLIITIRGKRS